MKAVQGKPVVDLQAKMQQLSKYNRDIKDFLSIDRGFREFPVGPRVMGWAMFQDEMLTPFELKKVETVLVRAEKTLRPGIIEQIVARLMGVPRGKGPHADVKNCLETVRQLQGSLQKVDSYAEATGPARH